MRTSRVKIMKIMDFSIFGGHFCPPGSGSQWESGSCRPKLLVGPGSVPYSVSAWERGGQSCGWRSWGLPSSPLGSGRRAAVGRPCRPHLQRNNYKQLLLFQKRDIANNCGWDVAEWLERLTVITEVATVLGSIPASTDTVESEGRQMKQRWIKYWKNY